MGYLIPVNSPKITVGTRTFAVACYMWVEPTGHTSNRVAVYELQSNSSWNEVEIIVDYSNFLGKMLADMQAKGGAVKYLAWLIEQINAFFASLFGAQPVVPVITTEPTTDDEVIAYVESHFAAARITLVNGVPVMQ